MKPIILNGYLQIIVSFHYVKLYVLFLVHHFITISPLKTIKKPQKSQLDQLQLPIGGLQGSLRTAWVKAETYVVALGDPEKTRPAPGIWR